MEVAGRVPIAAVKGLIEDALTAAGLPREDAAKCAALMAEADLTGADAHGVFRLPQYIRRIKAGVSVEELAEDIARRTLLQSLSVRPLLDASQKSAVNPLFHCVNHSPRGAR